MNLNTTLMCVECGRRRCAYCAIVRYDKPRVTERDSESFDSPTTTGIYDSFGSTQQTVPGGDGSPSGAGMWDEQAQQQSDRVEHQDSGTTVGPSVPASTATAQPPDLQHLSLTSPDSAHGRPDLPETVPAALDARERLRLEDDGREEGDEHFSRELTPDLTSSHVIPTSSLPNQVAQEPASHQTNTPQSDWESVEFPEASVLDEEHLVELFNDGLESTFRDWLGNGTHYAAGGEAACGEPGSSSSSSGLPNKSASGNQPPKRKRPVGSGDEDNDDRRKSRSRGVRSQGKNPLRQMLACHFCKRNPRRYLRCCNFGAGKISHVKQHIYRRHFVDVYCPRCMQQFDDVSSRDEHTRLGTCQLRDILSRPDGITSEQRGWLSRRMSPGTSEEQRWYTVWEYLFPGSPLPPSPYNNFHLSEDLFEFLDFITSPRGHNSLFQNLRGNAAWNEEYEALLGPDLVSAIHQLVWLWAVTRDGNGDPLEVDIDQPLAARHVSPDVPEDPHPTDSEAGAVPPPGLGVMDETSLQQANPAEVYADQAIRESRAERLTSSNIVPALDDRMSPMEMIHSLEGLFDRAQESRSEDGRLDLNAHEDSKGTEDDPAQPPLQLTESGIEEAGPSGQTLDVAAQGFEFIDFEYSSDVLAESSFLDWYNIDFENLEPEGWDGEYWGVE
ncbi:hypothetical protein VMCG_08209 [Cytospora schulzeri]|uniref:C2H2-type domain-containing protein n=1 Tax=Cytospora schulzeri TaxID=448051 RepID=A0A423VSP2_9PEZI|nr:hypothetical protein VMCG_08209 [Valsa malicola]